MNSVEVEKGTIDGNYIILRCETDDVRALWQKIKSELFADSFTGPILKKTTIIFYEDSECQDNHVLLYHFDPGIPVDTI